MSTSSHPAHRSSANPSTRHRRATATRPDARAPAPPVEAPVLPQPMPEAPPPVVHAQPALPAAPLWPPVPREPDAHGFDPADFEWLPVERRRRSDGWGHQVQRDFIEALADTGSVAEAARAVHMSVQSCYRLRRSPGAENFARAWEAALAEAHKRLVDIAFDRAVNGTEHPHFDKHGEAVYMRRRYSDRLLMFLLAAHHPDRYGHAADRRRGPVGGGGGDPAAAPAIAPPAITEALALLEPVTPADPHRLMHPADFANLRANLAEDDAGEARAAPDALPAPTQAEVRGPNLSNLPAPREPDQRRGRQRNLPRPSSASTGP